MVVVLFIWRSIDNRNKKNSKQKYDLMNGKKIQFEIEAIFPSDTNAIMV